MAAPKSGIERESLKYKLRPLIDRITLPIGFRVMPKRETVSHFDCGVIERFVEEVQVIVDVGANIGQSVSGFLRSYPKAHIYAFEPGREAFQVLYSKFGSHERVTLHEAVLSSVDGTVKFFDHETLSCQSRIAGAGEQGRSVESKRLDSWAASAGVNRIDFLKIDTEGHEIDVMLGATELTKREAISAILLEYGRMPHHCALHEEVAALLDHGFVLASGLDIACSENCIESGNALFVRRDLIGRL